ncbi:MAG: helix-turn-helix domain-containing protein [Abitibacteriaceae bacterium]|nr:helix-turn-helix domain-containing protein [Abditibacteriaceae bacterium]MBV9867159.1 helix-turn-helix domain-containing protein [Abditibacteriaceae bacterium]
MYLDGSRKQIIVWVQQGLNDREIGERLRVSRSTVRYWWERNGVERLEKSQIVDKGPNSRSSLRARLRITKALLSYVK